MNLNDEVVCGYLVTAQKKRVNSIYLDLIQEFDRLCRAAGLTQWLIFGALIGAVRHKGFIPWDDDVDVIMPRAEFDRLQVMTNQQFGAKEPYFLQNEVNDPTYHQTLIRFRRSDTTAIMDYDAVHLRESQEPPYNMGICLSIFPLDYVPKSSFSYNLRKKLAYFLMGINYRAHSVSPDKDVARFLCRGIERLVTPAGIMHLIHHCFRCPKQKAGTLVNSLDGFFPDILVWPAEDFSGSITLPFEDISVVVPIGYIDILTRTYGNYMEFPPLENRTEAHDGYLDADTPYLVSIERLKNSPDNLSALCNTHP